MQGMVPEQESASRESGTNGSEVVTFLLTDIEGSSELWEAQPGAMRRALARHDDVFARDIAAQGGRLIKSRGEGDSMFAVFARAADAAAAACAIQQELLAETWPTAAPLRVRMAIHTGDADWRDDDYYGVTVNRCARLRALASGGQIILSGATQESVQADMPPMISMRPLGVYTLRGSTRPEHVYQLVHPALPDRFPPLNARVAQCTNVPAAMSSFVGREWELGEIGRLLATTRLLTLTGSGGAGKTRLALQLAANVLDGPDDDLLHVPDGVWLIELAAVPRQPADAELCIVEAIAEVFGVTQSSESLLANLIAFLRPYTMMLVLDNCEHVIAACAHVAGQLLAGCPGLRVMATSQEPLAIEGEVVWRVPPLSLPDGPSLPPLARLGQYEAVRLFMDRARAQRPGLALTAANASAVVQICRQLDGIPLALELAAARVGVLSIDALAERLQDRFALLSGGKRSAPPRHLTLRAAIDWSYNLLDDEERVLLRRLSVFHGGWSLEASEAICSDPACDDKAYRQHHRPPETGRVYSGNMAAHPIAQLTIRRNAVFGLLAQLVAKSLVIVTESEEHLRYGLLETVRQYAATLLAEDEESEIRARHCTWFLALAEEAKAGLTGAQQRQWLSCLESELDNLRAALNWSIESLADGSTSLQFAAALWRFWEARGHLAEGRRWLDTALAGGEAAPPGLLARVLNGAGTLARKQGDIAAATALHQRSLNLYRSLGHHQGIAASLNNLGLAAEGAADYRNAAECYKEALSIRRRLNDRRGMAFLLNNLGNLAQVQGDLATAEARYEESLDCARSLGDRQLAATELANLGIVARSRQQLDEALARLEESLTIFRDLEDTWGIGLALYGRGLTLHSRGAFDPAAQSLRESLSLHDDLGDRQAIAQDLEALAAVASALDHLVRSTRLCAAAERLRSELGTPPEEGVRAAHEDLALSARARLGDRQFADAWGIGRGWSLPQAVAYALDDTGGEKRSAPQED
jgi:predicted ATPase/class 3 adenylate cyclase